MISKEIKFYGNRSRFFDRKCGKKDRHTDAIIEWEEMKKKH